MRRALLLLFCAALPGFGQLFGGGIKVGTPLTNAFDLASNPTTAYRSETTRYIVGPQFELRLPAGFAIELDALYTDVKYSRESLATTVLGLNYLVDADDWVFPLLLKKKFGSGAARPFVSTGAAFRRLGNIKGIGRFITGGGSSESTSTPPELQDRNSKGFVIGAGLEIRALFVRITPEIRFTRWGTENFREGVSNLLKTNKSQGQFLIGFSF